MQLGTNFLQRIVFKSWTNFFLMFLKAIESNEIVKNQRTKIQKK